MSTPKEIVSEKGFTIIEILLAMFISGLVMAGVFTVFQSFSRHTTNQDLLIEAQQNARAGIDTIQKELVLIGYRTPFAISSSIPIAESDNIEFKNILFPILNY